MNISSSTQANPYQTISTGGGDGKEPRATPNNSVGTEPSVTKSPEGVIVTISTGGGDGKEPLGATYTRDASQFVTAYTGGGDGKEPK
jgi:hypothetical protein